MKTKILFICTGNRDRSPTAEAVYKWRDGLEVKSAGVGADATIPLTDDLIIWAEVLMVMEPAHESFIRAHFPALAERPVYCLNIQDRYQSMSENLKQIIRERVEPILASGPFREGG